MRTPVRRLLLCVLFTGILAQEALRAHVAFFPRSFQAGTRHDAFYLRGPVEKEIPVVEIGFEIDAAWRENGGDVADFQEIPGWIQHLELDEKEKIKKAWWQAAPGNAGMVPRTFHMIWARVSMPDKPGEYRFPAWQKYSDGSVVWWNETRGEGQEADNPAPIVVITPKPAPAGTESASSFSIGALLAPAALLLSLAALVIALKKRGRIAS